MKSPWTVSTDSFANEPDNIMRNGNVYQLANGYMGYRGTLDEFGPKQKVGITLAGIYDQVGDAWREPVNAPNGGFTVAALGGRILSALGKKLERATEQPQARFGGAALASSHALQVGESFGSEIRKS